MIYIKIPYLGNFIRKKSMFLRPLIYCLLFIYFIYQAFIMILDLKDKYEH